MRSLTREQVRAVDACAIETLGIPALILMENAGRGAADAVCQALGPVAGLSVAIVAGGGNNGGDGFVIARHLAMRGARTETFLVSPAEKLSGDAAVNYRALASLRHTIHAVPEAELDSLADRLSGFAVVVDAVGGTGIRGALRGGAAVAVQQVNAARQAGAKVVAVDIPTGLDCDTGRAEGPSVRADLTITFVARKKGFDRPGAGEYTGQVIVADIGVPADVIRGIIEQGP